MYKWKIEGEDRVSYDLYLRSKRLTRSEFERYFVSRRNYNKHGAYMDPDTGVYFSFEFIAQSDSTSDCSEIPDAVGNAQVAFTINYVRPHIFGLQAEPELSALVAAFDCAVHDPQVDGMGDGPYSPGGFLRGWRSGNEIGTKMVLAQAGTKELFMAEDGVIERVWHWNLRRHERQMEIGDAYFLPRVNWAVPLDGSGPFTYVIWGEDVPIVIPDCASHVVLGRKRRSGLEGTLEAASGVETKLLPIKDIAALPGLAWREDIDGRVILAQSDKEPSQAIRAAFGGAFPGLEGIAKAVSSDRVLDASLGAANLSIVSPFG